MSEYINRGAAFDAITDLAGKASTRSAYEAVWKSARALKKIPAADVAPVVHGRWAIDEFGHYCTVCREYGPEPEGDAEIVDLLKYGTPYCPNCGAKMDGGADNG